MEWSITGQIPTDYYFSVPLIGDAIDQENMIASVFKTAENEINWQFMADGVIFKPSARDGFGVDRVDLILTPSRKQHQADIDIDKIILSEEITWRALLAYMKNRNIDDLLYLEANTASIVLWRMIKDKKEVIKIATSKNDADIDYSDSGILVGDLGIGELGKNSEYQRLIARKNSQEKNQEQNEIQVANIRVDWENIENKTKEELWQRMRQFLTTSQPEAEIKDIWANLMFSPKLHYESVLAQDILRADLTANLNAIRNSAIKSLSDFGAVPGKKSVLLCSGDFTISMDEPNILLALIDGLSLFGNIQILIDKRDIFTSTALFNIQKNGDFSKNISKLMGKKVTLISVEPIGDGQQDEIIVQGTIKRGEIKKDVYGLRNRIHKFSIDDLSVLTIHPVRGENIGGIEGYSEHQNIEGEIILDTRDHDEIRYGPEPKNNATRVHAWLAGLR